MPLTLAHTAQLLPTVLGDGRRLADEAFDGDFGDEDWEYALGGLHALLLRWRTRSGGPMTPAPSARRRGDLLYRARGWQCWRGTTWAMTPAGRVRARSRTGPRAEDDAAVFVLPGGVRLDLDGELTCDWRDRDLW